MPRPNPNSEIAASLDAPPELLPFLPQLLAEFNELGGDAAAALQLLDQAAIPPGQALDLGCGKGVYAVALAQRGWTVDACDLFQPFIDEANARASAAGVAPRCRFECADVRDFSARHSGADLVLMLGVGHPFGSLARTLSACRRLLRPGGHLLFDDAYETAERRDFLDALERHAGAVVASVEPTIAVRRAQHARELNALHTSAAALRAVRPDLAGPIDDFLKRQRDACRLLEDTLTPGLYLLRTPPAAANAARA